MKSKYISFGVGMMAVVLMLLAPFANTANAYTPNNGNVTFTEITQDSISIEVDLSDGYDDDEPLHVLITPDNGSVPNVEDVVNPENGSSVETVSNKQQYRFQGDEFFQENIDIRSVKNNKEFKLYLVAEASDGSGWKYVNGLGTAFTIEAFPDMNTNISGDDVGISVDGSDTREDLNGLNYIRGVETNRPSEMTVTFESDVELIDKQAITLMPDEGDQGVISVDSNGEKEITVSNDTITIEYETLEPEIRYHLNLPPGSVAHKNEDGTVGQFNPTNIDVMFYTEKKPDILSTSFNPSNQTFDYERSPFRPNNSIYDIPELLGINAIGVGVNQALVIQFDDEITDLQTNRIDVKTSPRQPGLDYSPEINEDDPSQMVLNFDTNHPDRLLEYNTTYEVTIDPGAVTDRYGGSSYAQNEEINIEFKTADGFNNAFLNRTAQSLNSEILETSSHNIAIDIPDVYIRELETIHYRDGLIADERTAPNLTNIDIDADADVATIDIETDRGIRAGLTRGANDKFSTAYAGLNADVSDIQVTAYDQYGKVLERRSFRLQGAPGSEFKNDYVPEITDAFGQTISLYDLMANPDIMQQVIEQIPVSELDRIGVFYPYFAPYDLVTDNNLITGN